MGFVCECGGEEGGSRGSREKGGKATYEPGQRVHGYLEHFILIQHGQERELILRAGKLRGELLARVWLSMWAFELDKNRCEGPDLRQGLG